MAEQLLLKASNTWLKRTFSWSNTPRAWVERIALVLIVGAAVGVYSLRSRLGMAQQVVLYSLLLLWLAVLARRGWLRLIGPMLFYDLLCTARRKRYFAMRALYAFALITLLCWMYWIWVLGKTEDTFTGSDAAEFAEAFFYSFLCVQMIILTVLTPAYCAGAIAEEKERKTLEFLLATDLSNREIVLSKFLSRLANLSLLLLAGMPILSILQLLGGIDPNLMIAGTATTALSVLNLAALSILCSVLAKRPRDAIAMTYLVAIAYMILSGASWLLVTKAFLPTWGNPQLVEDCVHYANAGNPIAMIWLVVDALDRGTPLDKSLPHLLRDYAVFHAGLAVICVAWSIMRLRGIALRQNNGRSRRILLPTFRVLTRPRVGSHPMLWKEIFAESGLRLNVFGWLAAGAMLAASGISLAYILEGTSPGNTSENINMWVRICGTLVACFLLVAVAARAATSISNEKDHQTFDALLTTPLPGSNILFAKWVGNIVGVRWGWAWLGAIYGLGVVTGGLDMVALPLLVLAWLCYASAGSAMGLWFSLVSRSSLRATVWTLLSTVGIGLFHWLLWMCILPFAMLSGSSDATLYERIVNVQIGFTPPLAMGISLSFPEETISAFRRRQMYYEPIGFALLGMLGWVAITVGFWVAANARFRLLTAPDLAGSLPRLPTAAPIASSTPESS